MKRHAQEKHLMARRLKFYRNWLMGFKSGRAGRTDNKFLRLGRMRKKKPLDCGRRGCKCHHPDPRNSELARDRDFRDQLNEHESEG